jgi:HSP20 family molecular chaperone IbpA
MVWFDPSIWNVFDPPAEARRIQAAVDALLATTPAAPSEAHEQAVAPLANVHASPAGLRLLVLVPGFRADDLDIVLHEDRLSLRGERRAEAGENAPARVLAKLERSFRLPFRPDAQRVQAKVVNGVLDLFLPRHESEQPRRIPVANGKELGS